MENNLFDLTSKTALFTGASEGLGQCIAIALAQAVADIIGVGIVTNLRHECR